MNFIEKEKDLLGKRIVFTHMAQFADQITLVVEDESTKEKGVFMVDKQDEEIDVYRNFQIRQCLFASDYLRKELNNLGVITNEEIEQYEEELRKKWKKDKEEREKREAENEYKQYLKLKEKYGNK